MKDSRLDALNTWLQQTLGLVYDSLEPASADASFRRYFRLQLANETRIVMDAPPNKEDCQSFIDIAVAFKLRGLNVPVVLAQDLTQGFLLLTDLGQQLYLPLLTHENVNELYQEAMKALLVLQSPDNPPIALPNYDHALLWQEMSLFNDWFIQRHLDWQLTTTELMLLQTTCEAVAQLVLSQPQVCVHRDFHSRNLMLTEAGNPGVLDFQDAVIGAVTYDLVSLLKDCYIVWPREQVEAWVDWFRCQLIEQRVIDPVDAAQFLRWFDWMGLQRHLKVLGIFSRLFYRDGKASYLEDIPRVLAYVLDVSARYTELTAFAGLMHQMAERYAACSSLKRRR